MDRQTMNVNDAVRKLRNKCDLIAETQVEIDELAKELEPFARDYLAEIL